MMPAPTPQPPGNVSAQTLQDREKRDAAKTAIRVGLRELARNLTRAGHDAEARIALKAEELLKHG